MTTKFSRVSRVSHERSFNLDSLERNHWRNRINQLKRELRESPYTAATAPVPALTPSLNSANSNRPAPRRRPAR
jgi:hypothetical protein